MITLYSFGPAFGLPDPSPFVTKAEMLLKLADLPYRKDPTGFRKAPKGKLPYIEDEGEVVPDSTFIRWHIEQKYGFDFDSGLSPEERGVAWAIEKLLEDNLYWASVQWRWLDDHNFVHGPAIFFRKIPWPIRPVVETLVRRKVRQNLHAHGMGRHTPNEQLLIASKTFDSLAAILADKPYLMGAKPCGVDATLFAFMAGVLCSHFEMPLRTAAQAHKNLVQYVEKMRALYFPENEQKVT
ncbi:MAG: glutathione S-transferase N-terminal domain-containing protein [Ottowia sp.]|nr:glutathione S-transferase N-terminal domain-containing protein [Ottowia sp.]